MFGSGLAFIVTHIDIDGELPIEIIPGHHIRRANDEEIKHLNELLSDFVIKRPYENWVLYDSIVLEEKAGESTKFHIEKLPKEKWKYWVVAFNGVNANIHKLEYASILLPTDIEFGFQVFYENENQQGEVLGHIHMPLYFLEKYGSPDEVYANAKTISTEELKIIGDYYSLYTNLDEKYKFIDHSLKNFSSTRRIPDKSELLTVGYFSIIESLITHAPRLNESLDSINHQIRNKMTLLRKKYTRQIPYHSYFLNASEEKIWTKLYGYRSCLAHGNIPDFQGEFQILKNHESVISFLKENIKELIIFSMKEPEFVADLKNC